MDKLKRRWLFYTDSMYLFNMKKYLIIIGLGFLSSCATHLPEFQEVESIGAGNHRVAAGVFGGVPMGEVGGSLFHSVGLGEFVDWSTQATYAYSTSVDFYSNASILTGPKFQLGDHVAVSLPIGLYDIISRDEPDSPLFTTPTLYVQLKSRRSEIEHMLFLRTEATYVPIRDEATAWATAGYKRTFIEKSGLRIALNVNITYIAIYGGLTFDLFR